MGKDKPCGGERSELASKRRKGSERDLVVAPAIVVWVGNAGLLADSIQVLVEAVQQEGEKFVGVMLQIAFKLRPKLCDRVLTRRNQGRTGRARRRVEHLGRRHKFFVGHTGRGLGAQ